MVTYGVPPEDEYRYRVVEVLFVSQDGRVVTTGDIREYKTLDGAYDCRDRWRAEGKSVAVQPGKLHWLSEDDDPEAVTCGKSPVPTGGRVNPS